MAIWWRRWWRSDLQVSQSWLRAQNRTESLQATRDHGVWWLASESAQRETAELKQRRQIWTQASRKRA